MSMSTLGAQLAALQGASQGHTSALPTSKRHEDAVGRGMAHSVQVGHSIHQKSHLFKASILFENAKQASNVPLSTVQENCISALRTLETETMDATFGTYVASLCGPTAAMERGLQTRAENSKVDATIQELLYRLALVMDMNTNTSSSTSNSTSTSTTTSCGLHVLEFLLRRYELHIRPTLITTTLLALLPHHEQPYFLRYLQLVDLASLGGTWAWLRPYSVPGAKLGRATVAQQMAKPNIALIRDVLTLATKAASLPQNQGCLSFCAATLVQAMTLQYRALGSVDERTCHALLPTVVHACSVTTSTSTSTSSSTSTTTAKTKRKEGFRNFGYILASTLVETSVLAQDPKLLVVTSIVRGLSGSKNSGSSNSTPEDDEEEEKKDMVLANGTMANGLVVALSLLQQNVYNDSDMGNDNDNDNDNDWASYQLRVDDDKHQQRYYGYFVDKTVLQALVQLNTTTTVNGDDSNTPKGGGVASILAALLVTEGFVDVQQLLASIWVVGWNRLEKKSLHGHAGGGSDQTRKKNDALAQLLRELLQEPRLVQCVWSQTGWTEALVAFLLTHSTLPSSKDGEGDDDSLLQTSLRWLKRHNAMAYDRGVTKALLQLKKEERMVLATWLGLTTTTTATVAKSGSGKKQNGGNPSEATPVIQLPTRVALEHADVEIRLDAIARLVQEDEDEDQMQVDGAETVSEALLRRVLADDSVHVACQATKAVVSLLDGKTKKQKLSLNMDPTTFASQVLQALYKWTERSVNSGDKSTKIQVLTHLVRLMGLASTLVEQDDVSVVRLVEGMGAHLSHSDKALAHEASTGLVRALKKGGPKKGKTTDMDARQLLVSDIGLLQRFARSIRDTSRAEQAVRRRFLPILLVTLSESLGSQRSKKADKKTTLTEEITLDYCLWALSTYSQSLSSDDQTLLSKALNNIASYVATTPKKIPAILTQVAELDHDLFESVGSSFITEVCTRVKDTEGKSVAAIAVAMEVAARSESPEATAKLLDVAIKLIAVEPETCRFGIVPALGLLTNTESEIRKKTIGLLSSLGEALVGQKSSTDLREICNYIAENQSSAIMGSPSFLAVCLQSVGSKSKGGSLQKSLLSLCMSSATASTKEGGSTWLNSGDATGGYQASLAVLLAAQHAGEATFPLLTRWELAGKPLLDALVVGVSTSAPLLSLLGHVALMLKGLKTTDSQGDQSSSVIIMSGPAARGGRKRSYSFGKSEVSSFLSPYPKDMLEAVLSIVSPKNVTELDRGVCDLLVQHVLVSESWGKSVFARLTQANRQKIATALLEATTTSLADSAEDALFALPLECHDLAKLLEKRSLSDSELASITYLADYSSSHSKRLAVDASIADVFVGLFGKFAALSSKSIKLEDGVDFACQSVLDALRELFEALPDAAAKTLALSTKKGFNEWVGVLVGVLGSEDGSKYRPLESTRSKKTALSVLTSLSTLYSSAVVQKLVPAIVAMVSSATSEKEASVVAECLGSVVPVYFEHSASAKLQPSDLMNAFIAAANDGVAEQTRLLLYRGFVESLSSSNLPRRNEYLGAFVAGCLASNIYYSSQEERHSSAPQLTAHVLGHTAVASRIAAILTLVSYARDLVLKLGGEAIEHELDILTVDDLSFLAIAGPSEQKKKKEAKVSSETQKKLCLELMASVCEIVASPTFCRFLRHSKMDTSTSILRLWQDLLLIQSVDNNQMGSSNKEGLDFWGSISEVTAETLESIQRHLPSHLFLAFATSLIKESDSEELRARALQLVAERALALEPTAPEAGLFRDMLPFLVSVLQKEEENPSGAILQQSILVALEHITRGLCSTGDSSLAKYLDTITLALGKSTAILESQNEKIAKSKSWFKDLDSASKHMVCTATLCAATTIRVCGPRALPMLPKLLRPGFVLLGEVNAFLSLIDQKERDDINQARLLQLSLLRMITGIAETIPQFLAPYLGELFRQTALPSDALRTEEDDQSLAVKSTTDRLCETLATKVPARQLLPSLAGAIITSEASAGISCLLSIMTMSIKGTKGSALGSQVNSILKAGTFVFDFSADVDEKDMLVTASSDMFLALILKLSEVQLRSLFVKLRNWRGDFDKEKPSSLAFRRFCFWSLSASLGVQLKSIFIPCLTTVFSDVVNELDVAVSMLCKKVDVKTSGGKKKQRLEEAHNTDYGGDALLSLQALLMCLEASLRSDAHDGGAWVRDGESQRFDSLLSPLGKFLQCKVQSTKSKHITYQSLVHGDGNDSGSVVECIVALASAAGDERLWKPLNHTVLQACSHETRSEVRKAGITCLVSLIRSIGEEYMVLIPECLPVLSELLEDTDEEIAGMAQECISMSEELLGESLEDSLR